MPGRAMSRLTRGLEPLLCRVGLIMVVGAAGGSAAPSPVQTTRPHLSPFVVLAVTIDGLVVRSGGQRRWQRLWQAPVNPGDAGQVEPIMALATAQGGHTAYAARYSGTLWQSRDAGLHWRRVGRALPPDFSIVNALAVDPTHPATIYVACDGGLYQTTNTGASWQKLAVGLTGRIFRGDIAAVAIDGHNPRRVWAGKPADDRVGGLFHSRDGGRTWTRLSGNGLPAVESVRAIAVSPATSATIYAELSNSVYRSQDGGTHWVRLHGGLPAPPRRGAYVGSSWISMSPPQPIRLYVALPGSTTLAPQAVYVSATGGTTWTASRGLPPDAVTSRVVPDPRTALSAYVGTAYGIERTTDGGRTWQTWNGGAVTGGTNIYDMVGMRLSNH